MDQVVHDIFRVYHVGASQPREQTQVIPTRKLFPKRVVLCDYSQVPCSGLKIMEHAVTLDVNIASRG